MRCIDELNELMELDLGLISISYSTWMLAHVDLMRVTILKGGGSLPNLHNDNGS